VITRPFLRPLSFGNGLVCTGTNLGREHGWLNDSGPRDESDDRERTCAVKVRRIRWNLQCRSRERQPDLYCCIRRRRSCGLRSVPVPNCGSQLCPYSINAKWDQPVCRRTYSTDRHCCCTRDARDFPVRTLGGQFRNQCRDVMCKNWRGCRLDAQFKPRRQTVVDWTGSPTFKPRNGRIDGRCLAPLSERAGSRPPGDPPPGSGSNGISAHGVR
jgi:hypothetical protein